MGRIFTYAALLFGGLLLVSSPGLAEEGQPFYKFKINNQTSHVFELIDVGDIEGQAGSFSHEVNLLPNESVIVARPVADLLFIDIRTGVNTYYTFSPVSFFQEKDTEANLIILPPNIPHLCFVKGGQPQMCVSGDNTDWDIVQVIGNMPYGPGKTTYGQVEQFSGVQPGAGDNIRTIGLQWQGIEWDTVLTFAGTQPGSLLQSVAMFTRNQGENEDADYDIIIDSALHERDNKIFRIVADGKIYNVYEYLPGKAVDKSPAALEDLYMDVVEDIYMETHTPELQKLTLYYAPASLVGEMVKLAQGGQAVGAALRGASKTMVVTQVTWEAKNKTYAMLLQSAPLFAKDFK